ncbi:MAG: hypothetical protein SPF92_06870 [Clostridia bacterium]|nr:hypothetical protein [Oscillospiraceae bacterium]MDY5627303.1 hypothetical protein [Clostridia bacterium]
MKILAFFLVIIGAFVCYGSKMIVENIIKKDDTDKKYTGMVKLTGFVLALVGAIIVFKLG